MKKKTNKNKKDKKWNPGWKSDTMETKKKQKCDKNETKEGQKRDKNGDKMETKIQLKIYP